MERHGYEKGVFARGKWCVGDVKWHVLMLG